MRSLVFSPKMEGTAQMELSLLFGDRFNYFLLNTDDTIIVKDENIALRNSVMVIRNEVFV